MIFILPYRQYIQLIDEHTGIDSHVCNIHKINTVLVQNVNTESASAILAK